ncbi:hypothetical protein CC78DRAFT_575881 [Lojkania enalia]|uniref:Transcription factor TFIIIC triple barrel domain-containing protein n=1 Tax=Lojkania enalia TaxID=147567 RepID=A0A9P4N3G2_9PLEO|nr:hypothetical protein CC78DRAFT_575881 [Didymosphaeria enalia]
MDGAGDDESEFEYEYDGTETEDFYITLDLSSIFSEAGGLDASQSTSAGAVLLQDRLRDTSAEHTLEDSRLRLLAGARKLEVIGLHTPNPLIMYDGQFLSCKWASAIGTDMFFVKPPPDTESGEHPLRALPFVDLLGMSSTKLMATTARLRPRDEVLDQVNNGEELSPETIDVSRDRPAIEETRVAPTGFLQRLNRAKVKRGDKSVLGVAKTSNSLRLVADRGEPEASTTSGTRSSTRDN